MAPHTEIVCSFALTFGVPMALAVREYWHMAISPRGLPPGEVYEAPSSPLPDAGARPAGPTKALPDCLIPRPAKLREFA